MVFFSVFFCNFLSGIPPFRCGMNSVNLLTCLRTLYLRIGFNEIRGDRGAVIGRTVVCERTRWLCVMCICLAIGSRQEMNTVRHIRGGGSGGGGVHFKGPRLQWIWLTNRPFEQTLYPCVNATVWRQR